MSSLDSRNFEEGQISQPVSLAVNVSSVTDSSHGNNLSRNGTKVSDVLPSSDVVSAGASSKQLPFSNNQNPINAGVIESEGTCRSFSLDEVLIATNNFDDALVIGIGGFGKVYKGFIDDSATIVAIKRLNAESKQGAGEFWMEVKMLSKLRHSNLAALIGYCNECQEMILVYEYIALGTLADHLYRLKTTGSNTSFFPLSWEERLEMCIGAARGLDHLHSGTNQSFIHRDVKSKNILIDKNWVVKISDFGLSKGPTSHSITHISTQVKGTFGYLDPDYFRTQRLTTKSDVYAFGVVLLEVLCGRPALDRKLSEEQMNLARWAQQCIKEGKLARVIDPSLSGQLAPSCLKSFVVLAKNCLNESPRSRPTMAEVLGRLELALLSQQRGRTEGRMTKAFQSMMDGCLRETKDGSSSSGQSNDSPLESDSKTGKQLYHQFSLADIRVATKNFNESFLVRNSDKVYKGSILIDGKARVVAIKRYEKLKAVGYKIHRNKLLLHPNILSLIGICTDRDELIVVHDYMANGSFQDHLHRADAPLSWERRLQICIGAAQGLEYIYANEDRELNYRPIEPSSILLDENWVAKVMLPDLRTKTDISAGIQGYSSVYKEDDLNSFGLMLLEVLTRNTNRQFIYDDVPPQSLLRDFLQSENSYRVLDPHLIGQIGPKSLGEFFKTMLSCLFEQGVRRPSIHHVVRSLQLALEMQKNWQITSTGTPRRTILDDELIEIKWQAPDRAPGYGWTEGPRGPILVLPLQL
ncbi:hypothetical protein RHMOL_Rhmol02G0071100 [Rhododendron molle]|uniref:Uncharacterized protein n=1 Tax=Rhododendron molle TaxID=49168 RepID=A0ACC0PQL9_RHOML|nr:hypothetical protein RHMOL_Rhmol02G0071100 [Rhododendron molle]